MNTHAEIKIPAQYEEAEEMKGGFAVVSEDLDKGYFYIDQNGNRLNSENYKFCDSFNDFLARVEKMDGSWSIITRDNRMVVENYDSINELPSCHSTLTGIGSGGFWGVGLGRMYVNIPEGQTDFIFVLLTHQLGIFGGICLILCYVYLLFQILKIALNACSLYETILVIGILIHIATQVVVNMGVCTSLLPNTLSFTKYAYPLSYS